MLFFEYQDILIGVLCVFLAMNTLHLRRVMAFSRDMRDLKRRLKLEIANLEKLVTPQEGADGRELRTVLKSLYEARGDAGMEDDVRFGRLITKLVGLEIGMELIGVLILCAFFATRFGVYPSYSAFTATMLVAVWSGGALMGWVKFRRFLERVTFMEFLLFRAFAVRRDSSLFPVLFE